MIKFKTDWRLKNTMQPASISPKPVLENEIIILSFLTEDDYDQWHAVRKANQIHLKPYEPEWHPQALNPEFFKKRLEVQEKEFQQKRGVFFVIRHKENKTIIGGLNLNHVQYGAARMASLGYWLDCQQQRRGYMTQAGRLVVDYAQKQIGLERLQAACLPDNIPSVRLLLRLGFEEEGYAKKYLQIDGRRQDHRLFGLSLEI